MNSGAPRDQIRPWHSPARRSWRAGAPGLLRAFMTAAFAIAIGIACATPSRAGAPGGGAVVTITNQLTFEPREITVGAGDTVEWRNVSLLVHTVTADPELAARAENVALPAGAMPFNSGNLMPEGTFRHRFNVPGRYRYFCIPHEGAGMVATVIVSGPATASGPAPSGEPAGGQGR